MTHPLQISNCKNQISRCQFKIQRSLADPRKGVKATLDVAGTFESLSVTFEFCIFILIFALKMKCYPIFDYLEVQDQNNIRGYCLRTHFTF